MGSRIVVTLALVAGCGLSSSPRWQPDGGAGSCGDGTAESTEACDDGNTDSGDGCNADCTSDESCGNGMTDVNELCDDGNTVGGDDCSADCASDESCGNGLVDVARGETCDDGNSISSDGCANNCQSNESCGNMVIDNQAGEACDPGNNVATAGCDPDCSLPNCGDGYRNIPAAEICDTAGNSATCDSDCTAPACGDSVFNAAFGEQCDTGASNGNGQSACRTNCQANVCGDSYRHIPSESCDTGGNSASCDGDCTVPQCGDAFLNPQAGSGEQCDAGSSNGNGQVTCKSNCKLNTCGDSYRYIPTEACDTGGSSSSCDGDCTAVSCGDGYVNGAAGEQCDAAGSNGNGQVTCKINCQLNTCGDGYRYIPGEACDTSGNSAACDGDCTAPSCGDGYRNPTAGEQCDDGNLTNGDGCSSTCQSMCVPTPEICGDAIDQDCVGGDPGCPPNDAPANPIDVSGGGTFTIDLAAARDDHTGTGCGAAGGRDVFYTFSLGATEVVYFDTFGSNFDSVARLLSGPCSALAGQLSCSDNACSTLQSQGAMQLGAGTYCIVVDQAAVASNGSSSLRFARGGRTGTPIATGTGTIVGNTSGQSNQTVPSCSPSSTAPDIGYYFLSCPAQTLTVDATTCAPGTNYDSMLYVRSASTVADIACIDDDPGCALSGVSSTLPQSTVSGPDLHWLIVDGFSIGSGSYELSYSIQ